MPKSESPQMSNLGASRARVEMIALFSLTREGAIDSPALGLAYRYGAQRHRKPIVADELSWTTFNSCRSGSHWVGSRGSPNFGEQPHTQ
jgi:hypothetical protein